MPASILRHRHIVKWLMLVVACGAVLLSTSSPMAVAPVPEPTLGELAIARYQVATKGFEISMAGHSPTDAPGFEALEWMRRRVKARLDIVEPKNDRVAFLREYLDLLKREEEVQERLVKKRIGSVQALLRAQYDRLEAEMLVKQAEAK